MIPWRRFINPRNGCFLADTLVSRSTGFGRLQPAVPSLSSDRALSTDPERPVVNVHLSVLQAVKLYFSMQSKTLDNPRHPIFEPPPSRHLHSQTQLHV
jgi:hypothetical protein